MFIQVSIKSVRHSGLHQLLDVAFRPDGPVLSRWPQSFFPWIAVTSVTFHTSLSNTSEIVADLISSRKLCESHMVLAIHNYAGARFALKTLL